MGKLTISQTINRYKI